MSFVPFLVLGQLLCPEACVRGGYWRTQAASMPVPKASVNKQDLLPRGKHQVRAAGERSLMQPVPVAEGMNQPSHQHLRLGVFASDSRHAQMALGGCQNIGHVIQEVPLLHLQTRHITSLPSCTARSLQHALPSDGKMAHS